MTDLPDLTDAIDAAARAYFRELHGNDGLTFDAMLELHRDWFRSFLTPVITAAAPAILLAERSRATAQLGLAADDVRRSRAVGDITPGVAAAAIDALQRARLIVNGEDQ